MVNVFKAGLVLSMALATVVGTTLPAHAFDFDAFRARLDDRRANLQNRLDELQEDFPDPPSQPATPPMNDGGGGGEQAQAEATAPFCRASVDLPRGDVRWSGNQLIFTPRVDTTIRARTNPGENWQLNLNYEGSASFTGEGVPIPGDVSFSGGRSWSGPGGNTSFRFRGQSLAPVVLAEIPRSEFARGDELTGTVVVHAHLTGCDVESLHEQFTFDAEEFGNLRVRSWRRAR